MLVKGFRKAHSVLLTVRKSLLSILTGCISTLSRLVGIVKFLFESADIARERLMLGEFGPSLFDHVLLPRYDLPCALQIAPKAIHLCSEGRNLPGLCIGSLEPRA